MAMGHIFGIKAIIMRAIGFKAKELVKEFLFGRMGNIM